MQVGPFYPVVPYVQGDKIKCTHLPWSSYSHQPPPSSQREVAQALGWGRCLGWALWGRRALPPTKLQNKFHLECSEVREVGRG